MKVAFKCRSCGILEDSDNAAERELPAACRNCGAGVGFDPRTGIKTYDDDNWIVLAKESKAALIKAGIDPDDVEEHVPWPATPRTREPMNIERTAEETLGAEDVAG